MLSAPLETDTASRQWLFQSRESLRWHSKANWKREKKKRNERKETTPLLAIESDATNKASDSPAAPIVKRGRRERRRCRKEAIVGQVSINFLQKGGQIKCFRPAEVFISQRGSGERDEGRGAGGGAEEEERDRVRFFQSQCTPNSAVGKECTRLRICVRIVLRQRRELRLL